MNARASAMYEGVVRHRRLAPEPREFTYRLYMAYVDLDELPVPFREHPAWSARLAPYRFRRRDYLGAPCCDLRDAVTHAVIALGGAAPAGPIRLLTQLSSFGWCFNPISVYYCFDPAGSALQQVLVQVTNTPWGERHEYLVPAGGAGASGQADKALHVSPFLDMDLTHDFELSVPGPDLSVSVADRRGEALIFEAELALERVEADAVNLARLARRYPAMPLQVSASIYGQAVKLWLSGTGYRRHPLVRPLPPGLRLIRGGAETGGEPQSRRARSDSTVARSWPTSERSPAISASNPATRVATAPGSPATSGSGAAGSGAAGSGA